MRPGIIIAGVVAIVVVIGGVMWINHQSEQTRLAEQRVQQAETAREEERTREEAAAAEQLLEDAAAADTAADDPTGDAARETDQATVDPLSDAAPADDSATIVGDEITEDSIVVQSATDEAVILDPAETATSVEMIDSGASADTATMVDASATTTADTTAGQTATDADELLTPENYDREEVLALIDDSPDLTADERSTLRALVEGAGSNPSTIEAAIRSIRAALDLTPMN